MTNNQVLFMSFWNPTAQHPQQGIFILEQAVAICDLHNNIIFLEVNVLPSDSLFLKKTIEESAFHNNRKITINLYTRLWKFYYVNPWLLARILYRIIKSPGYKINPAIIHSNVIHPCGVAGYILAGKMNAKLIISEHWTKIEKFLNRPVYKRIALKAYRESVAVICVSKFLSNLIISKTGQNNVIVIPNIINSQLFKYIPKPHTDSGINMMCVASWRPPKRLDLIFDALCSFAIETHIEINLRVVGNGPQVEKLKNIEPPENLHIAWLGYKTKQDLAALLQSTHVFMHASDIETFSIVTAEALSTGTPVLISNNSALPELIDENNGILVENDTTSWKEGIRKIVAKKYDYETISKNNRNKYSPEIVGNSIICVYDKVFNSLI
jgi:L-malate glycosyltransferase